MPTLLKTYIILHIYFGKIDIVGKTSIQQNTKAI